ncbi:MAG TPA: DUF6428 family protein [Pyrinomonadaceae bacterium]|nr:DUF6428 family protein [Pyrinomonadaceae bacterium]
MKLSELKSILGIHPTLFPRFILPDGDQVPAHYHLTEVGHVAKNFIDCGGTTRKTESCTLQLWSNDSDMEHRLDAGKFVKILQLGGRVLPHRDLDVEVEYDDYANSQFPITSCEVNGEHIDFTLSTKHTDCLARQKCGIGEDSCATEGSAAVCC